MLINGLEELSLVKTKLHNHGLIPPLVKYFIDDKIYVTLYLC